MASRWTRPAPESDSDSDSGSDSLGVGRLTVGGPNRGNQEQGSGNSEQVPVTSQEIREMLKRVIMKKRKGLQNFYGETAAELDTRLEAPSRMGAEMANKLMEPEPEGMGCTPEIAQVLTVLTLYDVAILIGSSLHYRSCLKACFAYSWVGG